MALLPVTKLDSLRIPLEEVREATNNFHEDNIISTGGFGPAYKGRLLRSGKWIKIAARRLDPWYGLGEFEFLTEVSVLCDLNHPNIVSMIGFCDEKGEKIVIAKYEAKGSLMHFLTSPKLTWVQRLKMSVGVARALSYLRSDHGRDYGVIHRNINSYTILLDENWEPKLSGFEISIKQSVNQMDRVNLSEVIGIEEYMDPSIEETGGVTYKSDTFSFGVVLFEILCGRLASIEDETNGFLAPLARYHYEKNTLHHIIHPDLWKQMAPQSFAKYSRAAHSCIEDDQARRRDMNNIVHNLEKALEFQLRSENPGKNLEPLSIPLTDIQLVTQHFSLGSRCGSTGVATLYRPLFDYLGSSYLLIKRFATRDEGEGEEAFYTELEALTTVKHHGIVTLSGFCDEGSEMIIVIDGYPLSTLDCFMGSVEMRSRISWVDRLKICIDVAQALNYIHSEMEDEMIIINRDINSSIIGVYTNMGAKITDFGLSVFLPPNQEDVALYSHNSEGTPYYIDPEYEKIGKLKRESDVYSFGVVLFEILCGRRPFDPIYGKDGMASEARRCYINGTLEDMIDFIMKEETSGERKLNKDSLDAFIEIAYQCVAETQEQRPTMKVVVKELERALCFQLEGIQRLKKYQVHDELWEVWEPEHTQYISEEQVELSNTDSDTDRVVDEFEKSLERNITQEISEEQVELSNTDSDTERVVDEFEKSLEHNITHEIFEEQVELSNTDSDTERVVDEFEKSLEHNITHEIFGKDLKHMKIPLAAIKLATEDFSERNKIELKRSYSTLYRAELLLFDEENSSSIERRNKDEVPWRHKTIIKRILPGYYDKYGGVFLTELKMLASVKHPNIVTLFGYCIEGYEMILVMESLSNGYLADYLGNVNDMRMLTWEKRLKICIDVAHALKYLHFEMEDQKMIINRNVNSSNIALDENLGAKITDFGLSVFLPPNQEDEALYLDVYNGFPSYYMDPEYEKTGKLKRESDVYSFGVVLFEILYGRLAEESIYLKENDKGLAYVARESFKQGTLNDMIDPIIQDEFGENTFILSRGPSKDSLHTFIEIANKCVAESQDQRPTMDVVVKELEKALFLQRNNKDNPLISLEDIKLATQDFDPKNYIGGGAFGKVYLGKLEEGDRFKTIVAKRLFGQGKQQFLIELQILLEYKHENIISLVGYCDENDEKIIVYEYASKSSLDRYLNHASLTWLTRLNICIEVASALDFLHRGAETQAKVIHRDIKTANILLDHDWKAKLGDFGLSLISAITKQTDYVIDRACGTPGYVDPLYAKSKFLTTESDIYSLGVVLFEILCGRSTYTIRQQEGHHLPEFVKNKFGEGKHEEVVFEQIREQIKPKSLTTFQQIAYGCLNQEREKRPTTKEVLSQLQKAMEFQISGGD